jgi:hypothetical protein
MRHELILRSLRPSADRPLLRRRRVSTLIVASEVIPQILPTGRATAPLVNKAPNLDKPETRNYPAWCSQPPAVRGPSDRAQCRLFSRSNSDDA